MNEKKVSEVNLTVVHHKTVITPVLGHIEAEKARVDEDVTPAANNTRWVFDVETDGGEIVIHLCDFHRRRRIKTDLFSFSLAPTSKEATKACFWGEPENSALVLRCEPLQSREHYSFRVAIDVMHSTTR